MINPKVKELMNVQINKEIYSAYLYLEFANYFQEIGLNGFASWYKKQAEEELEHAMKFNDYLYSQGEKVELLPVEAPKVKFDGPRDALVQGLKHEEYVTSLIEKIFQAAREGNDYRSIRFLNWFIDEQTEEEENAHELIGKFDLAKDQLYLLDKELKKRD